jgi:hypothetical protein
MLGLAESWRDASPPPVSFTSIPSVLQGRDFLPISNSRSPALDAGLDFLRDGQKKPNPVSSTG